MSDLLESSRVAELVLAASPEPWRGLGFVVRDDDDGQLTTIAGLGIRFRTGEPARAESAIVGWTLVGKGPTIDVDAIPTTWIAKPAPTIEDAHQIRVSAIDHIVIMTGSLDRTSLAIERALGAPRKRVRDAGGGVRQGFHRAGNIILEVVERPDISAHSPASLWGLVFVVDDLDATVAWLGPDTVSAPRDAVQSGRRISSIRSDVGLGCPVALMTPHVR